MTIDRAVSILSSTLGTQTITEAQKDVPFEDLPGFDSVVFVRVIVAIESMTGRELTDDEIDGLSCLSDISRLLSP